jgi:hypothetical protein
MMTVGFPALVMIEYSNIMNQILHYLSDHNDSVTENPKDRRQAQNLLEELIKSVNNQWVSVAWVLMIHFATLSLQLKNVLFYNAVCFMGIVWLKLV